VPCAAGRGPGIAAMRSVDSLPFGCEVEGFEATWPGFWPSPKTFSPGCRSPRRTAGSGGIIIVSSVFGEIGGDVGTGLFSFSLLRRRRLTK